MKHSAKKNYYVVNMKKVLYMVEYFHKKGYGKLQISPSISPSGIYWRCSFISENDFKSQGIIMSNWIHELFDISESDEYTVEQLAEKFETEHSDFLNNCKGENLRYAEWYKNMLNFLEQDELPYALSDYFKAKDFWRTTSEREIEVFEN